MLLLTIFSEAAASIVTQPFVCGAELERLAVQASRDCVRAAADAAGIDFADAVSLEILNGGMWGCRGCVGAGVSLAEEHLMEMG